jgi:soluble lytic murein transglycosylase-like protein
MSFDDLIADAASKYNLDPRDVSRYIQIESGGNPATVTGSYRGLMQLSQPEFQQFGGGDIHDPKDNINAGVAKLAADRDWFNRTWLGSRATLRPLPRMSTACCRLWRRSV